MPSIILGGSPPDEKLPIAVPQDYITCHRDEDEAGNAKTVLFNIVTNERQVFDKVLRSAFYGYAILRLKEVHCRMALFHVAHTYRHARMQ